MLVSGRPSQLSAVVKGGTDVSSSNGESNIQYSQQAIMLPKARPYLLEVGERINDDILGILPASTAYTDRCLVVTPSRIIGVGSDGSVEPWSYRDITRVKFGEGKKRFLGGHEPSYLFITLADGTNLNFMLIAEHDYMYRVATLVEEVFRKARLERL